MEQLNYSYLAKLVTKTCNGDNDAFAELYTATYKKQYRFTYQYVKDPYLAQDILQDVYISALKNIRKLKNPDLFVSWLQQINFRICFDALNQKQKHSQELSLSDEVLTQTLKEDHISCNPEKAVENKSEQTDLVSAIQSLRPRESQVLLMHYYNDMPIDEIANALDCSRSTIKRALSSGKEHLKQVLDISKGGADFEN